MSVPLDREENTVIQPIRLGNFGAFETLFRTYYPTLTEFANGYVHSIDMARDIVSDVFMNVWISRDHWAPRTTVRAYLFGAVRNRALNTVRSSRRWRQLEAEMTLEDDVPAMSQTPSALDTALESAERKEALWRAVDALPESRKIVMTLRWREQLSFEEIAEVLGTSPTAVRMQVSRAMRDIRAILPALFQEG